MNKTNKKKLQRMEEKMTESQTIKKWIFLLIAATAIHGMSSAAQEAGASAASQAYQDSAPDEFMQSIYVLTKNVAITPVAVGAEGLSTADLTKPLELLAGSALAVMETKDDPRFGRIVRLGFDTEEDAELPSDVWIKDTPEFEESLSTPYEISRGSYCYRYVKLYLLHTGKVHTYLPGSAAVQAAHILPKFGFQITGHAPSHALRGEVCVYSGGPQGYGHIEVFRKRGWWFGYGFRPHPMTGRHFLACFTK